MAHAQLAERIPSVSFRHPGELIKYKRQEMGYSQKELACGVKMSASGLSKVESGKHIHTGKILQICELLHINPRHITSLSTSVKKPVKDTNKTEMPVINTLSDLKKYANNWKDLVKQGLVELL